MKYAIHDDVLGEEYLPEWAKPDGEIEVTDWLCPSCLADYYRESRLEHRSARKDYHCPKCGTIYAHEKDISEGYQQKFETVLGELTDALNETSRLEERLKSCQHHLSRYQERFDMIKEAMK